MIGKSGTVSIVLRVTDSRGYFAEVTSFVIFQAYFSPRINSFTATRSPTDQDTNLSAALNFEIANVSNQNSRLYRIRYRVSGGSWSTLFTSTSYYSRVFTHTSNGILDGNNSYEVELFVQDSYSSATQTLIVTTAFELINYNSSGKGIAFGKVSEGDNFDVALPGFFRNGISSNGGGDVPTTSALYHASSGVLIDICDAILTNMITVEVKGNGYSSDGPILSIFQVYHYNSVGSLIQAKQANISGNLPAGKFMVDGGRVKLWFANSGPYQTFIVTAFGMSGVIYKTTISNAIEPSSSFKIVCALSYVPIDWLNVQNKPATSTRWPTWSEVTSKPSTFSPSSHSHGAGDLPNNYVALWSGTLRSPNTVTLSQSYTNFDFIILTYSLSTNTTQSYGSYCVPVAQIVNMDGQFGGLTWYGGSSYSTSIFGWFNGGFTSNTTVKVLSSSSTSRVAFTGIYGVKIT